MAKGAQQTWLPLGVCGVQHVLGLSVEGEGSGLWCCDVRCS